jgi:hypothetical protein
MHTPTRTIERAARRVLREEEGIDFIADSAPAAVRMLHLLGYVWCEWSKRWQVLFSNDPDVADISGTCLDCEEYPDHQNHVWSSRRIMRDNED